MVLFNDKAEPILFCNKKEPKTHNYSSYYYCETKEYLKRTEVTNKKILEQLCNLNHRMNNNNQMNYLIIKRLNEINDMSKNIDLILPTIDDMKDNLKNIALKLSTIDDLKDELKNIEHSMLFKVQNLDNLITDSVQKQQKKEEEYLAQLISKFNELNGKLETLKQNETTNEMMLELSRELSTGRSIHSITVGGTVILLSALVNYNQETGLANFIRKDGNLIIVDAHQISTVTFSSR